MLAAVAAAAGYFGGRVQGTPAADHAGGGADHAAAPTEAGNDANKPAPPIAANAGATQKLPAPRTPLKYVFADLQARANAGDAAAATRLSRDLDLCRRYERLDRDNAKLSDELLGQAVDTMTPQQLKNYRAQLDAVESRGQNLGGLRALCDGASADMLDSLVPNLQRAAQLGDAYARACYLDRGPNYDQASLLDHPQRLGDYRRSAQQMIDTGIESGDWQVVNLLRGAYEPGAANLLSAVLGKDAYQRYRYLKLFRLGAGADRSVSDPGQLDQDLRAAAMKLTTAQITQADAWVEQTFTRNFQGKPIGADAPLWDPCVFPYE